MVVKGDLTGEKYIKREEFEALSHEYLGDQCPKIVDVIVGIVDDRSVDGAFIVFNYRD
jgi:hypothetical protein